MAKIFKVGKYNHFRMLVNGKDRWPETEPPPETIYQSYFRHEDGINPNIVDWRVTERI